MLKVKACANELRITDYGFSVVEEFTTEVLLSGKNLNILVDNLNKKSRKMI